MRITSECITGTQHTTTGHYIRITSKGVFVDGISWCEPDQGVFILDITEEKK